jgi:hypothetical protein
MRHRLTWLRGLLAAVNAARPSDAQSAPSGAPGAGPGHILVDLTRGLRRPR